jgi:N-hydroxyarylamine O-acetyltransferase
MLQFLQQEGDNAVQTDAYLRRINWSGPVQVDAETLRRLHVAHLRAVPFENLSIHWQEPIVLTDDALFDKIVRRGRGGFCYELNGLFGALLRTLGFDVTMLSAGVATKEGAFGPDFDHMLLAVQLEERYLADVGFGDSFLEPLRLDDCGDQIEGHRAYRIESDGERYVLTRRDGQSPWVPQYRFGLDAYDYGAYETMCRYHQTSPQSTFTRERICSLATPDGRVTVSGMKLVTTTGRNRHERVIQTTTEQEDLLRQCFGISRKQEGPRMPRPGVRQAE